MVALSLERGSVWVVRLQPNQGREMGKIRPAVVLQLEQVTAAGLPTVVVAPLSSRLYAGAQPLRVHIPARDRLLQPSWVCVEQIRAIDRSRIGEGPLTHLTEDERTTVEQALLGLLGMR